MFNSVDKIVRNQRYLAMGILLILRKNGGEKITKKWESCVITDLETMIED